MVTLLKYLLWMVAGGLSLLGDWWFRFTMDHPEDANKRKLTKAGKIGWPIAAACFIVGFILFALDDWNASRKGEEQTEQLTRLRRDVQDQTGISQRNAEALAKLLTVADSQTLNNVANDAELRREVLRVMADDEFRRAARRDRQLWDALSQVESRLGGKAQAIRRIQQLHPTEQFTPESIAIVCSLGLRFADDEANQSRDLAVIRLLRGIEADIIALQEVVEVSTITRLVSLLPEFDYAVADTGDARGLRSVLLFRKARVTLLGPSSVINPKGPSGRFVFARPPVSQRVRIAAFEFDVVNVHMKSPVGMSPAEFRLRKKQEFAALFAWLNNQTVKRPFIIMGVFFMGRGFPVNVTEMKQLAASSGGSGQFIDLPGEIPTVLSRSLSAVHGVLQDTQVFMNQEMLDQYIAGSVFVHSLTELLPSLNQERIVEKITDHNPLTIALDVSAR